MRVRLLSVCCFLEVKYCITGVNVYMEMYFVDKTWLIFHTWQHFSALLIWRYHNTKEKKVSDYFGRNNVHFPNFILCMSECVCVGACVRVRTSIKDFICVRAFSFTVIFDFSGATRFLFFFFFLFMKVIPKYWTILWTNYFFFFNVASTVFYFFPSRIGI